MSTGAVVRACDGAFARLCELGRGVPEDTPAAGLLAAAARQVDSARRALVNVAQPDAEVRARLAAAGTLLDDVAALSRLVPIDGVDRLSVLIRDLRITLDRPPGPLDDSAEGPERRG